MGFVLRGLPLEGREVLTYCGVPGLWERREPQGRLEHQERLERLEHLEHQERREPQGHRGRLVCQAWSELWEAPLRMRHRRWRLRRWSRRISRISYRG